jgi:hypothetical protein
MFFIGAACLAAGRYIEQTAGAAALCVMGGGHN